MKRIFHAFFAVIAATVLLTVPNSTAWASGTFNSRWVNLVSRDDGRYVGTLEVQITTYGNATYHADLFGPGFSYHLKDEYVTGNRRYIDYKTLNRVFNEGDRICAQGWKADGHGGYSSVGLPCFTIHAS